jgi:hypothetical protein
VVIERLWLVLLSRLAALSPFCAEVAAGELSSLTMSLATMGLPSQRPITFFAEQSSTFRPVVRKSPVLASTTASGRPVAPIGWPSSWLRA